MLRKLFIPRISEAQQHIHWKTGGLGGLECRRVTLE